MRSFIKLRPLKMILQKKSQPVLRVGVKKKEASGDNQRDGE